MSSHFSAEKLAKLELRKQRDREKKAAKRRSEPIEKAELRKQRDRERKAAKRQSEASANQRERLDKNAARQAKRRASNDHSSIEMSRQKQRRMCQSDEDANNIRRKNTAAKADARQKERDVRAASRASFSLTQITDETNFDGFEQDAEAAILLYHLNSGCERFRVAEDVGNEVSEECDGDSSELCRKLVDEIRGEVLSPQEQQELIQRYLQEQGRGGFPGTSHEIEGFAPSKASIDACITGCGCCGMRDVRRGETTAQKGFVLEPLSNLPSLFHLKGPTLRKFEETQAQPPLYLPTSESGELQAFPVWKLHSVYESQHLGHKFHLHPELVHLRHVGTDATSTDVEEMTFICAKCHACAFPADKNAKPAVPPNSLPGGIDFGDHRRLNLEKPTDIERRIIALHRHYHTVVKVSNNQAPGQQTDGTGCYTRRHSILFRHSCPVAAAIDILTRRFDASDTDGQKQAATDLAKNLGEIMKIQLLDSLGRIDRLALNAQMSTTIKARPHVIYQWLAVLQRVNEFYSDKMPQLPDYSSMFADMINGCCDQILQDADRVSDAVVLDQEGAIGSDISRVRLEEATKESVEAAQNQATPVADAIENPATATFSYVMDTNQAVNHLTETDRNEAAIADAAEQIQTLADTFGLNKQHTKASLDEWRKANPKTAPTWMAGREDDPVDEYEDLEELLVGAFPDVFILGTAYKFGRAGDKSGEEQSGVSTGDKSGKETPSVSRGKQLNEHHHRHLLLQYTTAAATNRELLFYLFDYSMRHNTIHQMNQKVRDDPRAFQALAELIDSDDFKEKIKQAAADPDSKVAKEVLRTVQPVLSFGGRNNILGPVTDSTSVTHAMAMAKRYGPASSFVTITPDDVANPTSFRLAIPSKNNSSFPAVAPPGFLRGLQDANGTFEESDGQVNVVWPISSREQTRLASMNPVAAALEFQVMIDNILSLLVGCELTFTAHTGSKKVRTRYFKNRQKGIFGRCTAFFGMVETQARGALHFHVILFGGLSPNLLEHAACTVVDPENPNGDKETICLEVQKALDEMYFAHVPREWHVQDWMLSHMMGDPNGRLKLQECDKTLRPKMAKFVPPPPGPDASDIEWRHHFYKNVLLTGIHRHMKTCHKPPGGVHGCRQGKPNDVVESTGPVQLIPISDDGATEEDNIPRNDTCAGPCNTHQDGKQDQSTMESAGNEPPPKFEVADAISPPMKQGAFLPGTDATFPMTDDRIIAWELKRPIIEELPAIDPMLLECGGCDGDGRSPNKEANISHTCHKCSLEAKKFCIHQLSECVQESGDTGESMAPFMVTWLESLPPHVVVRLYCHLNDQLPTRNGYVVETSQILANVTGGSTNAILLGNSQQSKAALFYVAPYLCKNKVALEQCLTALESAQKHVQKFPSRAADTGTSKRTVQHLFTRVMNSLHSHVEVSDTQVALSLLGTGTELSSETFAYFGAANEVNFVKHEISLLESNGREGLDLLSFLRPSGGSGKSNTRDGRCVPEYGFGSAPFWKVPESEEAQLWQSDGVQRGHRFIAIPFPVHYRFRGRALENFTREEYSALVRIRRLTSNDDATVADTPETEEGDIDSSDVANEPSTDVGRKRAGRHKSNVFRFAPQHPLYHTHGQYLQSLQPTLIMSGHAPQFPGPPPSPPEQPTSDVKQAYESSLQQWKQKADEFAQFFLICYRPNDGPCGEGPSQPQVLRDAYTWEALCKWIAECQESPRVIDRCRLDRMVSQVYGLRTQPNHRKILSHYRFRARDTWDDETIAANASKYRGEHQWMREVLNSRIQEEMDCPDADDGKLKVLRHDQIRNQVEQERYLKEQSQTLDHLFGEAHTTATAVDKSPTTPEQRIPVQPSAAAHRAIFRVEPNQSLQEKAARVVSEFLPMKGGEEAPSNVPQHGDALDNSDIAPAGFPRDPIQHQSCLSARQCRHKAVAFIDRRKLSPEQKEISMYMVDYFEQLGPAGQRTTPPPEAPVLLLTGDPGSGKSYTTDTIMEIANIMNSGPCHACSYNGIAAFNVDGETLCKLLNIPPRVVSSKTPLQDIKRDEKVRQIRSKLQAGIMCLFIVDEVSTLDASLIAAIDCRLQQLRSSMLAFGGVACLFVGDFNQLPAVAKDFLPAEMVEWARQRLHEHDRATNAARRVRQPPPQRVAATEAPQPPINTPPFPSPIVATTTERESTKTTTPLPSTDSNKQHAQPSSQQRPPETVPKRQRLSSSRLRSARQPSLPSSPSPPPTAPPTETAFPRNSPATTDRESTETTAPVPTTDSNTQTRQASSQQERPENETASPRNGPATNTQTRQASTTVPKRQRLSSSVLRNARQPSLPSSPSPPPTGPPTETAFPSNSPATTDRETTERQSTETTTPVPTTDSNTQQEPPTSSQQQLPDKVPKRQRLSSSMLRNATQPSLPSSPSPPATAPPTESPFPRNSDASTHSGQTDKLVPTTHSNTLKSPPPPSTTAPATCQPCAPTPVRLSASAMKEASRKARKARSQSTKPPPPNKFRVGTPKHRGCDLFSRVRRFHLHQQQRSSGDEAHTEFVKKLSRGEPISSEDFRQYKPLTPEDVALAPEEWKYAPVLVATNSERMNITHHKSVLWARDNKTHVFRWKMENKPLGAKLAGEDLEEIETQEPIFWQYFVAGADAFLNQNINGDLGLVNGAAIRCHSLSFSEDTLSRVEDLIDATPIGGIITLDKPPLSVNVEILPTLDGKVPSRKRHSQLAILRRLSITQQSEPSPEAGPDVSVDDTTPIVIPLGLAAMKQFSGLSSESLRYKGRYHSTTGTYRVEYGFKSHFPFDLGFAMTVNKAQGRTIHRVVIALSDRHHEFLQMKFASIFVAFSRVRKASHLRILYHHDKHNRRSSVDSTLAYISKLKPAPAVVQFYYFFELLYSSGVVSLQISIHSILWQRRPHKLQPT